MKQMFDEYMQVGFIGYVLRYFTTPYEIPLIPGAG